MTTIAAMAAALVLTASGFAAGHSVEQTSQGSQQPEAKADVQSDPVGSPAGDQASGAQAAPKSQPPRAAVSEEGFALESGNGDYRLQIGLLLQADGRFALDDSNGQVVSTFGFRRIRPYFRGRFARRFEFYLNPDFAGGTLVVQDAYVDTVFSPAFRIRAGKGKAPFGLERLHSGSNLTFFARAQPTNLAPNRDLGLQVLGDLAGGIVSYAAAVMNGVTDGGSADVDTGDSKDVVARLVVRPWNKHASSPLKGLGLAIAGSRGAQAGAGALPVFRTTSLEQIFFSYNGAAADGVRTRYSPQASYYFKAFGAFAEYVRTETPVVEDAVRDTIDHESWQLTGLWVITGEAATDGGAGIRPRANFDFGDGHWGALQVAARYHTLSVDERALTLGFATPNSSLNADAWTLGLNWYLSVNFRYTFGFERTVFDDDPDGPRKAENAFVFRTQVNF